MPARRAATYAGDILIAIICAMPRARRAAFADYFRHVDIIIICRFSLFLMPATIRRAPLSPLIFSLFSFRHAAFIFHMPYCFSFVFAMPLLPLSPYLP